MQKTNIRLKAEELLYIYIELHGKEKKLVGLWFSNTI